jgi:sulfofructose kinase
LGAKTVTQSPSTIFCIGLAAHDFVFGLQTMPTTPSKHSARSFAESGGGGAATFAVTIARLGGEACLLTRLGDDTIGDAIIKELKGEGVDCSRLKRYAGCKSSVSAVLVDEAGERMIINYRDQALPTDPTWMPKPAYPTQVVLADSRWPEGSLYMLRQAREAGCVALLDADLPGVSIEEMRAATVIAFSKEGLAASVGFEGLESGLRHVAGLTDARLIVTDGENGCYWLEGERWYHQPAFPVVALDGLAAGDVFHGALALALSEGQALPQAITFASAAAAIKVSRFGGRSGAPVRAEVEAFLKSHPVKDRLG